MKVILYILVTLVALTLFTFVSGYYYFVPNPADEPRAATSTLRTLSTGQVIGYVEGDVATWLGIPFAAPPVADLRWRSPQPALPWTGQRQALTFGERCPQFIQGQIAGSEDCLFINIWAPANADTSSLHPVMFWIHGGGNSIGDASTPIYHGDQLSRDHDLVVVSIQYRLGPLGWFRHKALREGASNPEDASGNFGTLDIIAGLNWVQGNIHHFGGNPDNVTIFGESAGGFNVLSMMASPLAAGRFAKAISQSGGLNLTTIPEAENFVDALEPGRPQSSSEVVNRLLIKRKLASDRETAKTVQAQMSAADLSTLLRGLSPAEILTLYPNTFGGMLANPDLFADGHVLPKQPKAEVIFSDVSTYNAVPVMLGTNRDETKLFTAFDNPHIKTRFGLPSGFVDLDAFNRDNRYATDLWKVSAVDALASNLRRAQGGKVYAYRFDVDDWHHLGIIDFKDLFGASHAFEIPFVFNQFSKPMRVIFPVSMQSEFDTVAAQMGSFWAEFAYHGSPGSGRSGELPFWSEWPEDTSDQPRLMVFDTVSDQGLRMVRDHLTLTDIKRRFLNDQSFDSQADYCLAYQSLFGGEYFDAAEYQQLGGFGCALH